MRIGILTGGGDAPGLNGIIESVSKSLMAKNHEAVGIIDGFEGIFKNEIVRGPRGFVLDDETRNEVDRLFDLMIEATLEETQ